MQTLHAALAAIDQIQQDLVNEATALAKTFYAERERIISAQGDTEAGFMPLTLSVSARKGGALRARWVQVVFRNGKHKTTIDVPNKDGDTPHLLKLKALAPAAFHELVTQTEEQLRILRRRAEKVAGAKRQLTDAAMIGTSEGYAPATPQSAGQAEQEDIPHF